MKSKKLKLYASCIPVRGYGRSIICDLNRNSYVIIPNDMFDMLNDNEGKSIDDIKVAYSNMYDDIITEYVDFLLENDYCFLTNTPEYYPKLDLQWHYPFTISNAIIDYSNNLDVIDILAQLEDLNCINLEVRLYKQSDTKIVSTIITHLETSKSIISTVGFIAPYNSCDDYDKLVAFCDANPRISYIYFYKSPQAIIEEKNGRSNTIYYFPDIIESESHCGIINQKSFIINIKNFTEAQKFNSCLNKKISIDKEGNIKNCPSMKKSYGNVNSVKLKNIVNTPEFTELWNIKKDDISICKDCEFRYICTDCRAFLDKPEDIYSKPLKCGYNPYTNIWEEWSENPLKINAIEYYQAITKL